MLNLIIKFAKSVKTDVFGIKLTGKALELNHDSTVGERLEAYIL